MKLISRIFTGILFGFCAAGADAQALQWTIGMGGAQSDVAQSLHIDPSGNVFVTGRFVGTADFDPGPGVVNLTGSGMFLAKYDANGNLVWVFQIGPGISQYALALEADPSGNILITGHFTGIVDFDPGAGNTTLISTGQDVFIAKYDTDGNFIWARNFGGPYASGHDLKADVAGNILVTGFFQATADFDPGAGTANRTSAGGVDIFLAKYDANGNFIWVNAIGGIGDDYGEALEVDAGGNVYMAGNFENTADFDPGPGAALRTSLGSADIFIAKYDAAGNYAWANTAGNTGFDTCEGIVENAAGSFVVTGHFTGVVDFDPGPAVNNLTAAGSTDIFLAQFDDLGMLGWAKSFGGNSIDYGDAVITDSCGNIYLTGYFTGTADFDPGPGVTTLNSAGAIDIFIARFDALGNLDWAHAIGGTGDDFGLHVEVSANTVFLTGYFENTADFDTGPGTALLNSAGSRDVFIAKYTLCIPDQQDISVTICPGDSYIFNGDTLSVPGMYTAVFKNAFCCDSIVQLELDVSQQIINNLTDTICSGQSYYVGNTTFSATGLYQIIMVAAGGCDSIVNLDLTVLTHLENNVTDTICSGQSYYVGNFTYSTSGFYQGVLIAPDGCDSIVNLNLTVLPPIQNNLTASICNGQSYYVGNFTYSNTGMYQAILVTPEGCDSIVDLNLTVLPNFQQSLTATICNGQSYQLGGTTYTTSGVYQNTLTSSTGCDSTVTLNLTVLPPIQQAVSATICSGQSYTLGASVFTQSGQYQEVLTTPGGCDSTVTLNLTVLPPIQQAVSATICSGQSYTLGTSVFTQSGQYQEVFTATNGCDSTVTLSLTVLPPIQQTLSATVCNGESYTLGTSVFTQSGQYQEIFTATNGCDSTVTLNLTVLPPIQQTVSATVCNGESYTLGTSVFTQSGQYQEVFTTANGCDSVVDLSLHVLPVFVVNAEVESIPCAGQSGEISVVTEGGIEPFQFSLNDGPFQSENLFGGLQSGVYEIVVQDDMGCTSGVSATLDPAPVLTLVFPATQLTLESGDSIVLTPIANFTVDSFVWQPVEGLNCPQCWEPLARPARTISYQLAAYSPEGCEATAMIQIKVVTIRRVYIPNVFMPDDDGLNDTFTLYSDEQVEKILRMSVFDRWGEEIFNAGDFSPGDLATGWDGSYKGKDLSPGVYVYLFEVLFTDGTTGQYSGDVTLLR